MKTNIMVGGVRVALPSKLPRISENTPRSKRGILYQLKYQPELIEENAVRFHEIIQQIKTQPFHIVELFGGVGINAQILEFMFNPSLHRVYPNDRWCYGNLFQLGRKFNWSTSILEPLGGAGGVVLEEISDKHGIGLLVADFPDWTVAKSRKQYAEITKAIFSKASWVLLTDSTRVPNTELDSFLKRTDYIWVAGARGKTSGYLLFKRA